MTWNAGPFLPSIGGQNFHLSDAPAVWLPDGNILFAASPGVGLNPPTHFFEFTTSNFIAQVADTPNALNQIPYYLSFVLLPSGQVFHTDSSATVEIYTPSGSPNPSWAPVITNVPKTLVPGQTYQIAGRQLNGLTEGASYGDDVQAATNFPLVRIANNSTGHVVYARTSGFSSRSVAPNAASRANFTLPANIELGPSSLVVVANGIPSSAISVNVTNNVTSSLQVTGPANITGSGTQSGPFSPAVRQYQLSASTGSLSYTISAPNWLNVSPSAGTVTTTPITVTFSWSNNAINLANGIYAGNVNFTNTTNGQGNTSLNATLTVNPLVVGRGGH
jgi:hypothetical protein